MHVSRLLVLLAASSGLFGAVGTDTFHWSGRVPPGQLIEVRGVNGSIHAEPAVGRGADVIAYKNGQRFDGTEIKGQVVGHKGCVTMCAVYPSPKHEVSAPCTVRIPERARLR